jgi:hypothetical protein
MEYKGIQNNKEKVFKEQSLIFSQSHLRWRRKEGRGNRREERREGS